MPLHIKLLGIGCRKSKALKNNLYKALARLPELEVEVEEVTRFHDILEYQIAAAPALLIEGRPAYQDEVPEVEELYAVLKQYVEKQKPMKKILVPTDFSDVAANAYRFAQKLAAGEDWAIEVMHAYHPSFDYSNPYLDMPAAEFDAVKRELMEHFISEHTIGDEEASAPTAVAPKTELRIGFAGEEIVRDSKRAALIVMGTTGQGNIMEKVFGSVSTQAAQNAHCPVLLIPGGCRCNGFENIIYASNYQAADEAVLRRVADTLGLARATIHFVHVEEVEGQAYKLGKVVREKARGIGMPDISVATVEVECADVQEGILRYAEDAGAGLIVVGTVHRSLLERLFHRSVTKRLAFQTTVPMMVLHYDD